MANIETTLAVDGFPLEYQSVRFPFYGIESHVSGVAVNNALALKELGSEVILLSLLGDDQSGERVREALAHDELDTSCLLNVLSATPQSVIQYDPSGKRQIFVDLKDLQERQYPMPVFLDAVQDSQWLILGTLNMCRPFLFWAKERQRKVACDLHTLSYLEDEYHQDFLHHSNVIFMSNEYIKGNEYHFARDMVARFPMEILVIGMGSEGALLFERATGEFSHFQAKDVRPVVNTVGAGDALFSAFMHFYSKGMSAQKSLARAVVFAGWKIGINGASLGFLSQEKLEALYQDVST